MDTHEIGSLYEITAAGYDPFRAVFLGRLTVAELAAGDFIRILAMGGLADMVVRIDDIRVTDEAMTLVFDWNGWRDGQPGGSLLPDDHTLHSGDTCREVWRPEL